jgi:uncharacterized cupredoxin-like copper-binding protein
MPARGQDSRFRFVHKIGVASIAALLLLGACAEKKDASVSPGGNTEAAAQENVVEIGLTEYAFGMPEQIEGGMVTLEISNQGEMVHEMAFGKIEGDHDMADVQKALKSGSQPKWFSDIGGIPLVDPGMTVSLTRELEPGRYILMCFLPVPGSGKPHVMEGMVHIFDAVGTSEATAPQVDATVVATDKGFDVPSIEAGDQTLELVNEGTKAHEFAIYSLNEGMTEKDIGKWFESGFETPKPALFPGGMQSIEPGTTVWIEMTFESGRTYLLEDFEAKIKENIEVS